MYSSNFSGSLRNYDSTLTINQGTINQEIISANAYYVFNYKRFSYPAAFSQSWIQTRSAGSFLVGISLFKSKMTVEDEQRQASIKESTLNLRYLGIGVGYGYNLVLFKKWLFHFSTLPQLLLYSRSTLDSPIESKKIPHKFPDFYMVNRLAVVHHFKHVFAGLSAVSNIVVVGDVSIYNVTNVKWQVQFFIGVKL